MNFCSITAVAAVTLIAVLSARAQVFTGNFKTTKGDPVSDVVVALIPVGQTAPLLAPKDSAIAQRDQEFTTYVTVVQEGAKVAFPNNDSVQHHVYSLSKPKKFELPLYNPGQTESFMFDVSGTVTLGCNIHDWMIAYLIVVPTPYFAKSDETGSVSVKAPAGIYRVEIIHPRLAKNITEETLLTDGGTKSKDYTLTLKPDRRIRRGLDAKSGGYR
ncbi:methylamine utilization protein [Oleiharenicola lentus]|uniref:methylamine utilization protein n=1 Tax=Oleiharenicola lentus TaxID=2508720 RepID=UPI003F67C23C